MILVKRILLLLLLAVDLFAQAPPVESKYKPEYFNFQEIMIPMRDGVRLQTVLRTPKNATGPLPILLVRTPYGVPENANSLTESALFDDLIGDGYVFVTQNIRGRFKSEGTFVMQRPPHIVPGAALAIHRIRRLHAGPVHCSGVCHQLERRSRFIHIADREVGQRIRIQMA